MFSINQLIDLTEQWLVSGKLNAEMLGENFQFVSPFWQSSSRKEFIDKFHNPAAYQETSLSKIVRFDPVIKLKGYQDECFSIILQYHTRSNCSVWEAVYGKVANGYIIELRTIYDLAETKKALQLP